MYFVCVYCKIWVYSNMQKGTTSSSTQSDQCCNIIVFIEKCRTKQHLADDIIGQHMVIMSVAARQLRLYYAKSHHLVFPLSLFVWLASSLTIIQKWYFRFFKIRNISTFSLHNQSMEIYVPGWKCQYHYMPLSMRVNWWCNSIRIFSCPRITLTAVSGIECVWPSMPWCALSGYSCSVSSIFYIIVHFQY